MGSECCQCWGSLPLGMKGRHQQSPYEKPTGSRSLDRKQNGKIRKREPEEECQGQAVLFEEQLFPFSISHPNSTCLLEHGTLGPQAEIHSPAGHLLEPRHIHGCQPGQGLQIPWELILTQLGRVWSQESAKQQGRVSREQGWGCISPGKGWLGWQISCWSAGKSTRLEFCFQIQMCPVVSQLVTDTLYPVLCSFVQFEIFWLRKLPVEHL